MSYASLGSTTPSARKRYRCMWCWQFIESGERHVKQCGVSGGEFQSNRFHPECDAEVLKTAAEEGGYFEWTPGEVRPPKLETAAP